MGLFTELKALIDIVDRFQKRKKNIRFEYLKFFKKLAIYDTGHGIVINSLEIKVLDKLEELQRFFDVRSGGGCKDIHLPTFEEMKQKNEKKRFVEPGFWYKSDIPCKLEIKEDFEDRKSFSFKWQPSLEKGRVVKLSYAFSIPCMFPIENGIFKPEKALNNEPIAKANFTVKSPIQHFEYEIAFRGVELSEKPTIKIFKGDHPIEEREADEEYFDPFYTRYRFSLKKPRIGYNISIQWKWKTEEGK